MIEWCDPNPTHLLTLPYPCKHVHVYSVLVMIMYLLTLHISIVDPTNQRADGLPWWSLSQVLVTKLCVCSVCVWVCVLLCLVFIIAVRLGNKVIFYQLSSLTLQVTNSQYILQCHTDHFKSLCARYPQLVLNSSHPLCVIVATHLPTSKGWKPEFGLSVPGDRLL